MLDVPASPGTSRATARLTMADIEAKASDLLGLAVADIGGQLRPGQVLMSEAVARCLGGDTAGALFVQAGTGTGKSLAYSIPAALHSVSSSQSVVIATATLALQHQLSDHDLPVVRRALGSQLGRPLKFDILKGRHNYLCLERVRRGPPEGEQGTELFEVPTTRMGRQASRLRRWAEETETGDRDEIDFQLDGRVWASFSTSARECPGAQKCRSGEDCFAEAARRRCKSADIVITNHAMLAIHLQGDASVLPDHCAVIVDEAHELVDRVTTALTRELSGPLVERAAARARRFLEPEVCDRIVDCGGFLSDVLAEQPLGRVRAIEGELLLALTSLRDAMREASSSLRADADEETPTAGARAGARSLVNQVHESAGALLELGEQDVAWAEGTHKGARGLKLAPLSVTQMLSTGLFGRKPTVLTSATLAYAGSLERTALGMGAPTDAVVLDVGSPFEYRSQAILYCAAGLPKPGRDGPAEQTLSELGDLIEAAGGRTLALFSSWRGVDAAFEYLTTRFGDSPGGDEIPILRAQRGEPPAPVIRQFVEDAESVLLGTLSLWQGVDVPGPACILVAIDRIPFPRPDDPLVAARQEYIDSQGGSGFASVAVPRAALLLAQGSGRLIRSPRDRGVVAILDPRLATAGYSKALLRSMPPFYTTSDGEVVRAALRRLAATVCTSRHLD